MAKKDFKVSREVTNKVKNELVHAMERAFYTVAEETEEGMTEEEKELLLKELQFQFDRTVDWMFNF